jgi:uncharacterized membrane protein
MSSEKNFYGLVAAAGLLAGLRSVSAPATVSTALARGDWARGDDALVALAARFAPAIRALALGEMAADKLPGIPSRTAPPILAGRLLMGAGSGLLLARAAGRNPLMAALLAGLMAIVSSFIGLRLRTLLSERLRLPVVAGLVEDAVVVGAASAFVEQAR